jgi:CHRD domain
MMRNLKAAVLLLFVAIHLAPAAAHAQAGCVYRSTALGGSMVPPTSSHARGVLESGFDGCPCCPDTLTLEFRVWYYDLEGEPTGAHICRGSAGESGDVVFTLFDGYFGSGARVNLDLDPLSCWDIHYERLYLVIETTELPSGAVRGQMLSECWSPVTPVTWGWVKTLYR